MPVLRIETYINALPEVVFDLARNIDVHTESTAATHEKAIAGVTSGLISLGETVTWRARHFGIWFTLTSKITAMEFPVSFTDEMMSGPFKGMRHDHYFKKAGTGALMSDIFAYRSPLGFLGSLADYIFLKKYMLKFLKERNSYLKQIAEQK